MLEQVPVENMNDFVQHFICGFFICKICVNYGEMMSNQSLGEIEIKRGEKIKRKIKG